MYLRVAFSDHASQPAVEHGFLAALKPLINDELSKGLLPEHLLARLLMELISEDTEVLDARAEKVIKLMLEMKSLDAYTGAVVRKRSWNFVSLQAETRWMLVEREGGFPSAHCRCKRVEDLFFR